MRILGFEKYAETLEIYLKTLRDLLKTNEKTTPGQSSAKEELAEEDNDESENEDK